LVKTMSLVASTVVDEQFSVDFFADDVAARFR
jgi:hypothetical protein